MFFIIAISILTLATAYVGARLITPAPLSLPAQVAAWLGLLTCVILPPLNFLLRQRTRTRAARAVLAWVTFFSMGLLNYLFLLLAVRDVIWLLTAGLEAVLRFSGAGIATLSPPSLLTLATRADWHMSNMVVLALAGVLLLYGIYRARHGVKTVTVNVPITDLPADLAGLRLVQISDLHVGLTITREFVQKIVDQVNNLAPDLIAFTGDLADGPVEILRAEVAPLAKLRARHGVFFVTGNHEYYSGAEAWLQEAARLGFITLLNQHCLLEHGSARLLIAGVTDYSAGHLLPLHASDPQAALAGAPSCDLKILLAHQPRSIAAAARAGFDLQLSGHTHGGQFYPWNLLVPLQQPYTSGLHRHGRTWIYVSRGTGYWGPPLRLGAPAEITVVRLVRAS